MTLSYAGISLYVPTNGQQVGIQAWLDSWSDLEFAGHPWPGKDLTGMTFLPTQPYPHPKIGSLYWPFGASRWAVGHFLATDNQLAQIRVVVYPGLDVGTSDDPGDGFVNFPIPAPLAMLSKAAGAPLAPVTASLYLLPPRPIHQIQGANGLNLLTLVDQRYFWWYVDSDIQPISSATTWATIYGNLADQLALTINVDPISSSYFFPAPEFTNYYQNLPTMLDAVAYNCGQRIVCSLAGAVTAQNAATDTAILQSNITNMNMYGAKLLGGAFNPAFDFPEVLPKAVHNVTPIWLNGVPTVLDPLFNSQEVMLLNQNGFNAATGFYNFTGVRGFDGIKTFRDTFHGLASDFAGEIALAQQIALDYWQRIAMAYLDVTVAHPFTITPEGLHDLEWSYVRDRVSTRIYKTLWNWEPEQFLHGDGNGPFSGNSTLQPFRIEPFFAQVSSPTGASYPWVEVVPATGGTFTTKTDGRTGTATVDPAYEFNGSTSVAGGTTVLMWRGFQNTSSTKQEWLFAVASGGGTGTQPSGIQTPINPSSTGDVASGIEVAAALNGSPTYSFGPNPLTIGSNYIQVNKTANYFVSVELKTLFDNWSTYPSGGEVEVSLRSSGGADNPIAQSIVVPMNVASFGINVYGYGNASGVVPLTAGTQIQLYIDNRTNQTMQATVYTGDFTVIELVGLGSGGGSTGQITAVLNTDATNATNSMANLTGLNVTLSAGKYAGRMDLWLQNLTPAEGAQFDFNGGALTPTLFLAGGGVFAAPGTDIQVNTVATSISTVINWSTVTGLTNIVFDFSLTCSVAGTFIPRFAENSSHSSGTLTIKAGSNIRIDPLA